MLEIFALLLSSALCTPNKCRHLWQVTTGRDVEGFVFMYGLGMPYEELQLERKQAYVVGMFVFACKLERSLTVYAALHQ